MIVGRTGFLGYHLLPEALKRGCRVDVPAIDDVRLGDWYPERFRYPYNLREL